MPPRRHAVLAIGLEDLNEEPQTGLWCDSCSLPSAIALDFVMTLNGRPHGVLRATGCVDCGKVTHG